MPSCHPEFLLHRDRRASTLTQMEPLPSEYDYDRALDYVMKLLAQRSRSRWEIRDRMRRAGFDDQVVAKVDARLVELQILDDRAFAQETVEHSQGKGMSSFAIRRALRSKGLDGTTVEEAMRGADSDAERALELARRRARTYGRLPSTAAYRRLASLLSRNGYEEDLVAEVCRRVLGEPQEG